MAGWMRHRRCWGIATSTRSSALCLATSGEGTHGSCLRRIRSRPLQRRPRARPLLRMVKPVRLLPQPQFIDLPLVVRKPEIEKQL